jgi:tRNA(Ile2) C34 agmatinyltransferase TiaS
MDKFTLDSLKMSSRAEILTFLKKLWADDAADCPVCGSKLELLHKKAKKSNCDWQCRQCGKVLKTLDILDELNKTMP